MNARTIALLAACLLAAPAYAQHNEDAMFGGPAEPDAGPAAADAGPPAADAGAPGHDEAGMFGAPSEPAQGQAKTESAHEPVAGEHTNAEGAMFGNSAPGNAQPLDESNGAVPNNPLTIGGTLYLRAESHAHLIKDASGDKSPEPPSQYTYTMPNLLDVYLDARPNDRVRGMVVGRLTYNPAIDPTQRDAFGRPPRAQVNTFLDQFWLNFDIARTVFITAGKQHVKWGTGRFWNPTDFLQPVRLDPLAVFDERTGVTMIKAHIPWEKRNWNFYGFGILEGNTAVDAIGKVGGALRAELLLGPAELGLDAVAQRGRKPRYGVDISSPVGPFDVYAEAAFHDPRGETHYRLHNDEFVPALGLANYESYTPDQSLTSQVVAGGNWQTGFGDNNSFTLGAEYFYNPLGADDPALYPYEILKGAYTPFYAGQHYAGLYALMLIPTAQAFASNSFVFSTIGNLSDKSFVTRLDYSIVFLQHLRFEAYGSVYYGTDGGEFRFGIDTTNLSRGIPGVPAVIINTPLYDLGVALRVSI